MNQNNNDYAECRRIRRQIACDDPGLTKLTVVSRSRIDSSQPRSPGYFFSVDEEWEEDGKRIGKNTHIEEMIIEEDFHRIADGDLEIFLSGVAKNRSIRKLTFHRHDISEDMISNLFPLFKNNENLERLGIFFGGVLDCGSVEKIVSGLAGFESLKEFVFSGETLSVWSDRHGNTNLAVGIIDSLAGHPRLKKLCLTYVHFDITLEYAILAVKLKKRMPELAELDLSYIEMGDDGVKNYLAAGLFQKRTLKKINLRAVHITKRGWMAIFDAFQSQNCRLEELNLSENIFDNDVRISIANYLAKNKTLKILDLSCNGRAANAGWGDLFSAFQSPTSALEKLNLASNSIDDDAANTLTNALVANNKLRELNLSSNHRITTMAWENFLIILQNPNSSLEKLYLSSNSVGDNAVISLANTLVDNKKLRELDLSRNHMITLMGWESFLAVLRSPNSALETLSLDTHLFNDATIISFASSLENNHKLEELVLVGQWYQPNITVAGWAAFSLLLCDTSSILDTHLSNHTLQKLSNDDNRSVPEDVRRLLQVNRENSKRQAARAKVIQTHFSDGFIDQPFVVMHLKVLPHAISWMGRGGESNEIDENHYGFIRSKPSLFDRK